MKHLSTKRETSLRYATAAMLITISILALPQVIQAEVVLGPESQLLASDGNASDYFGHALAVNGDYAIIGAFRDQSFTGTAYIFQKSASGWTQTAKLLASDGAAMARFGCSVSVSGDYAIIGASQDSQMGSLAGAAYVFHRDGTNWTQMVKLTATGGAPNDYFGESVCISGDYAIVGSKWDDTMASNAGAAYIFCRSGETWTQTAKLTAFDGAQNDYFGSMVAISGDYAIVGSPSDDDAGSNSGSAYLFHRDGSAWTLVSKLTASDAALGDSFGCSVSISGDYAIIGASGDDDVASAAGAVYLFHHDGTAWTQFAKLTASDGTTSAYLGYSVSISGDYAVAANKPSGTGGAALAATYVFHLDNGQWTFLEKYKAYDAANCTVVMSSAAIDGPNVLFGAPGNNINGASAGAAYFTSLYDPRIPGDANLDGIVNFSDYLNFSVGFGSTGTPGTMWEQGDFNEDGVVNFSDYLVLSANYGSSGGVGEPAELKAASADVATPDAPLAQTLPCTPLAMALMAVIGVAFYGLGSSFRK